MKIFLPALLLMLFASCHPSENMNEEAIDNGEEKQEVYNGFVNLAYNVAGNADTALLFVHGWCINKEYFSSQVDYFSKRYKVVTLDLGGHGKSGNQRLSWGVQNYASDVITVIDSLNLKNVILIGHSMGGDIVMEAALQRPNKVIGLVGIDNFKDITPQYNSEQIRQIAQFMTAVHKDFYNTALAYTKGSLFPANYADTVSVNRVINDIQHSDSAIATKTLESLIGFGALEPGELSKLKLKLHIIASDFSPVDTEVLKKYCLAGYSVKTIKGTGHYPMIEKPAAFNALLEETLNDIANGK